MTYALQRFVVAGSTVIVVSINAHIKVALTYI